MSSERTVEIKDALPHQQEDDESPARFKVLRWGRRTGKSVLEIKASVVGHGPIQPNGKPLHEGMIHGWAIAWLAPDFSQAKNLWNAEIRPRFEGKSGVRLTKQPPYEIEILNPSGAVYGGLYMFSMENVLAMRGLGNRLKGVCIDEPAHMDLAAAWDVIRPTLMDNKGWAILGSTTNAGLDGNADKMVPSYFNRLCADIMAGRKDADWRHSHKTARDNPKIDPVEFEKTRADVELKGAVAVAQEMEAELLTAGVGLAFPEWDRAVHVRPADLVIPMHWPYFAGLDWGYNDPGVVTLCAAGPEDEVLCRADFRFQYLRAEEAGKQTGMFFAKYGIPQFVAYDSSMDDTYKVSGMAATYQFTQGMASVLKDRTPFLLPTVKEGQRGVSYRRFRKLTLHEMLARPGGRRPRLTFHPDAAACVESIPVLPLDSKDIEDVDTKANDHAYDSLTYGLLAPRPKVLMPPAPADPDIAVLSAAGLPTAGGRYKLELPAQQGGFTYRRGEKRDVGL